MHDPSDPESRGESNFPRRVSPQHLHASVLQEVLRPERLDWSFTVVRHPRRRLLSEYLYRSGPFDSPDAAFKSFPRWWEDARGSYLEDNSAFDNHLRPQVDFLIPGLEVVRFEDGFDRIQEVEMSLSTTAGHPEERENVTFPLLNRANGSVSEETFSPEIEQEIERLYQADFEAFGYPLRRNRSMGLRHLLLPILRSASMKRATRSPSDGA
jgi:hypothetical protein